MKIPITEIASLIESVVDGDTTLFISNPAKIEEAKERDITFLYQSAYEKYFPSTKASAIIVKPGFNKTRKDITYLEHKDPNKAFNKIILHFFNKDFELKGISSSSSIHPSVQLGENTAIGENVVIEEGCVIGKNTKIFHNTVVLSNSKIGDNCLIFHNVSIREEVIIGNRVIIHCGTVVGSDGFGYVQNENREYVKVPQIGNVIIEDDVELGANVCIDRASIGATIIKKGVKIDNLVQIAHNVIVGEHTAISGQTGISGSVKIGNHCIFAGQVGVAGHIEIGDNIIVAAQSGISKSLTKPGIYFGYPAKDQRTALRTEGHIRNLEDYANRIKQLEKKIEELEKVLNQNK